MFRELVRVNDLSDKPQREPVMWWTESHGLPLTAKANQLSDEPQPTKRICDVFDCIVQTFQNAALVLCKFVSGLILWFMDNL